MLVDPLLSSMGAGALHPKMSNGGNARGGESGKEMKYKGFFKRAFAPSAPGPKLRNETDLEIHAVTMGDNQILNSLQITEEQLDAWQNRRRGKFINHTPRSHEPYHGEEPSSAQQTVYQDQSSGRSSNPMNEYNGNIHLISLSTNLGLGVQDPSPAELDSKEVTPAVLERDSSTGCGTSKEEVANETDITEIQAQPTASEYQPLQNPKSRAIQTSGKEDITDKSVCSPHRPLSTSTRSHSTATRIARYSPLEPLVARHRREITGSDVDVLPPHVDIDDINDTATFMAVQEYCDDYGQDRNLSLELFSDTLADRIHRICREADVDQIPDYNDNGGAVSAPLLHNAAYPSDGFETTQSPAPTLPIRNPERINAPPKCVGQVMKSRPDEDLDFLSAAEGRYSPYHCEAYGPVTPPDMRRVVEKPSSSSSSSSSQEKYSFSTSTPGHELLIKDDQLNDLNYFLRNTGPPTLPVKPSKRKAFGFGMLGKKGHEDQAQDTQSPKAGVPPVPALPPMLPVCAREERTKNGTRYVKILIPEDHDSHGQTKPSPIADENRQSKRYSANCVWTQEMLNPLGSSPVEDVIAGYASSSPSDSSPSGSPKTVVHTPRSPKPSRRLPARVPVNSHPLAGTRQDRTRARKLRDLHKSRTTTMLLDYGSEANHNEEYSTPQRRQQVLVDSKEWVRLQRLNKELARELATAAGLEENGEGFTPEYVLEVFQMVHRRSY